MKLKSMGLALLLTAGVVTVAFYGCEKNSSDPSSNSSSVDNGKKTAYDQPTLSCGDATTLYSIDLVVTAGASGAPSGFSVQWIAKDVLDAYTGTKDYAGFPTDSGSYCKASFSGNANISRYNLTANQSVHVTIGDLLLDNGASTLCPDALDCGTAYVFRVFAHGDSKLGQSRFGGLTVCSTLACDETCNHFGFGHWKSLCPDLPNGLMLGTNFYSAAQLCCILNNSPNPGNGLLIVAHQLIAAKLNGLPDTNPDIINADAYIGSNVLTQALNGDGSCNNAGIGFKKAGDPNTAFPGMIGRLHQANETCGQ